MLDAIAPGFHFAVATSETSLRSHYSTLKTMKEWIKEILIPYIEHIIKEDNLDPDQNAILYIDCYPIHAGKPFKSFIYHDHPNIIVIFVPWNCIGIFQLADVSLQHLIKHSLKQSLYEYLANTHCEQMATGICV